MIIFSPVENPRPYISKIEMVKHTFHCMNADHKSKIDADVKEVFEYKTVSGSRYRASAVCPKDGTKLSAMLGKADFDKLVKAGVKSSSQKVVKKTKAKAKGKGKGKTGGRSRSRGKAKGRGRSAGRARRAKK